MEWAKEEIILKQRHGSQNSQILVEGDVIVPDSKPDVTNVLRCQGEVKVKDFRVGDERVNLSGELEVCILYASAQGEHAIYSIAASLPMEDVIYVEGLQKEMQVSIRTTLDNMGCEVINDRKIGIRAVVGLTVTANYTRRMDAVVSAEGNAAAFLENTIAVEMPVIETRDRFMVKEEIPLSAGKLPIDEILCVDVQILDRDVRPMDGRVAIRSNLLVDMLYNSTSTISAVPQSFVSRIPFNGYVEVEGMTPRSNVSMNLDIIDYTVTPVPDDDGEANAISLEGAVEASVNIRQMEERQVISDAYVPGMDVLVQREQVTYPVEMDAVRNQFDMKEILQVVDGEEYMLQADKIWGNMLLDEVKAGEGYIDVEGILSIDLMYTCANGDSGMCMLERSFPFSQRIDAPGVRPDDYIFASGRIIDLDYESISDRQGEVLAKISLEIVTEREEIADLVTDIQLNNRLSDAAQPSPSVIIYRVQRGDSLWSIAKKFDTTIERILRVNDIEEYGLIYPDQKLLIVRSKM